VTPEQDPALVAAVLSRGGHSSSINRPVAVRRRAAAAPQLAVSMQQVGCSPTQKLFLKNH
jgi:anti-sigma-K factor RskA